MVLPCLCIFNSFTLPTLKGSYTKNGIFERIFMKTINYLFEFSLPVVLCFAQKNFMFFRCNHKIFIQVDEIKNELSHKIYTLIFIHPNTIHGFDSI